MTMTKVFMSGNSQAIRLPKEYRIKGDTVEIVKKGNTLIIREVPKNLARAFELLTSMPKDFFASGRDDDLPQDRESF